MKALSVKFYDRLTVLYPIIDYFLKPQKQKFITQINAFPEGSLLEIGVGNGSHLKYYTSHKIIGIDTSQGMLAKAKKLANSKVELLQMDGEALLFADASFDYVVLSHVITVVENPEKLMAEVFRVLKPTGKLFILNHFTPDNWLQYLDKAFHIISGFLYFKSVFQITSIKNMLKFRLLSEKEVGFFSYFKILVYEKNL